VNPCTLGEPQGAVGGDALELAIVIPTFKEIANVEVLIGLMAKTMTGIAYELIFVDDDSPDGTAAKLRGIAIRNPRVRVLQRIGRRGLASACIEGMLATPAPYIGVMDADLQHDERILPDMLHLIKHQQLDVVIGSRNIGGGSMGEFSKDRVLLSSLGARLSMLVCRCSLSDPMSGFFIVDRKFFEEVAHRLSGVGFKILVDLISSSTRPVRFGEIPYRFRTRASGESKLDVNVGVEYLTLLLDKAFGNLIPVRFVLFGTVGAFGLVVHLAVLGMLQFWAGLPFLTGQVWATVMAIAFNFLLNNLVTFRDRRLRGWSILPGLVSFYAACSIGALANLALAKLLISAGFPWWIAGAGGMIIGSVWNYGVNAIFTWRRSRLAQNRYRGTPFL
jgi:dolichol-phosphate mannosyltransferase